MDDKEKVIEYLENEILRAEHSVNDIWLECVEVKLLRDALALLKEQKAEIEQLNRFVNGFSRYAMPVIRCKDCKYLLEHDNGLLECEIKAGYFPVKPEWFCADGERK